MEGVAERGTMGDESGASRGYDRVRNGKVGQ